MRRRLIAIIQLFAFALLLGVRGFTQVSSNERAFPQSKSTIEQTLKTLRNEMAGRLPTLEGFAQHGDHPLDRYKHGYYQTIVELTSMPSGGTMVRVTAKVTAWYSDPLPSGSEYELLPSNGRIEGDLLNQLADQLATAGADVPQPVAPKPASSLTTQAAITPARVSPATAPKDAVAATTPPGSTTAVLHTQPEIAAKTVEKLSNSSEATLATAPMPRIPENGGTFSASVATKLRKSEASVSILPKAAAPDVEPPSGLLAEAESLEEVLRNQAHPKNLVAVRKSGTPVVSSPSLNAKTLFMASEHDEFELLDFKPDWVHVRISGLSRGWIWRDSVEMPEGIPDAENSGLGPGPAASELFKVNSEETAPFPGDWAPLRGKNVRIVSVQKVDDAAKDPGEQARLAFAKSVLDKAYAEISEKSPELAGVVVIFDSADGGMIAATFDSLKQWKAGSLSDAALWHQCYFDPPETIASGAGGSN